MKILNLGTNESQIRKATENQYIPIVPIRELLINHPGDRLAYMISPTGRFYMAMVMLCDKT